MPHLQFDTTVECTPASRNSFIETVASLFADHMDTGTDHIAVTFRTHGDGAMWIGRGVDGPVLVLDADIRRGRSFEQRRSFGVAVMDRAIETFGIPEPNLKVTFTEHDGNQMMGYDRIGSPWTAEEPTEQ
ncbi:MAG: tautomerase [Halobacteriales archaeon]|nr:tautomerase [Halobacteriales archaeon]